MLRKANKGISLNDLSALAKTNPKYKKLFIGLKTIDASIVGFVNKIVMEAAKDSNNYFCRTELMNQCYTIYLYNADRQVIVGKSWPLADFLDMCAKKTIEIELNMKIRTMLLKFNESNLSTNDRVNWVY